MKLVEDLKSYLAGISDPKERAEALLVITTQGNQFLKKLSTKTDIEVLLEKFKLRTRYYLSYGTDEEENIIYDITLDTVLSDLVQLLGADYEDLDSLLTDFGNANTLEEKIGYIYSDWGNPALNKYATVRDLLEG